MTAIDDGVKTGTKRCSKCTLDKPFSEFHKNPRQTHGRANYCKSCASENRQKEYHQRKTGIKPQTRAERFIAGLVDPSELSMDELAGGFIYQDDGTRYGNATFEKRALSKFNGELSRRLNKTIKDGGARALEVIYEIMDRDTVEPGDRLKAATWWAERVIGKTPEKLELSLNDAPHETIFENLTGGSREDHRKAQLGQAIDAEIVEMDSGEDIVDVQSEEIQQDEHSRSTSLDDGKRNPDDGLLYPEGMGSTSGQITSEGQIGTGPKSDETVLQDMQPGRVIKNGLSTEDVADNIADKRKAAQELKKRVAEQKKKRYAARAMGASSLASAPWLIDWRVDEDGLLACLVPPANLTPDRLARIAKNNELTNDPVAIARYRADKLAAQVERLKKKIEGK
jgi:hypothetical protein